MLLLEYLLQRFETNLAHIHDNCINWRSITWKSNLNVYNFYCLYFDKIYVRSSHIAFQSFSFINTAMENMP